MKQKLMRRESAGSEGTEGSSSEHAHSGHRLSRSSSLIIMLLMTVAFCVVELTFGYMSHSMALVADAFHMLSDVMALGVALACLRVCSFSPSPIYAFCFQVILLNIIKNIFYFLGYFNKYISLVII
ncbi:unnamed protein product [Gongylonema pulchrum]|uniref:SLC30A4 n=1 Tax=Gongylonema pulchrum TaxID=637853 RepID=A0A183EWD4_9BILA|nr:unnamed protein product [Gongylonema pulchrum]